MGFLPCVMSGAAGSWEEGVGPGVRLRCQRSPRRALTPPGPVPDTYVTQKLEEVVGHQPGGN